MKLKVIKTDREYKAVMARVDEVFDARPGTPKGDELELLLLLVETYEKEAFPIDLPHPIAAIRFRMDQQGLKQKDLEPYIGSKSKVSEVLNGQRELSLTMIRKLVTGLGIPAEVLLRGPGAELKPNAIHNPGMRFGDHRRGRRRAVRGGLRRRNPQLA
jgi:HTH-type transcriptional regulator/antitoxin HigA